MKPGFNVVNMLILFIILLPGCTNQAKADELYEQGIQSNDHAQYDKALDSLNKSLELNPQSGNAWLAKGITLFNMRRFDAALESVNTSLTLDPGSEGALVIRGEILSAMAKTGTFSASPAHNPDTITAIPHSSNTTPDGVYCIITEYGATRATGANLIPLTAVDFLDFPEFTRWMNGSTGSGSWYNDARTVGDFIDCQGRYPVFLNLSCRNLSPEECSSASKKSPDLFVYDGRYYSVSCLPGFGLSGHPGLPANMTSSCP